VDDDNDSPNDSELDAEDSERDTSEGHLCPAWFQSLVKRRPCSDIGSPLCQRAGQRAKNPLLQRRA